MRIVVVPAVRAEALRQALHAQGVVDRTVRMAKRDGNVWIPLKAEPAVDLVSYGARIEDRSDLAPRPSARNPSAAVRERLRRHGVPEGVAPRKWERFGDVVVLRLSEAAEAYRARIGSAFAEALDAQTVVQDVSGIHGVLRTPQVEILWGRGMEVVHAEGGVRYMFDVAKVMFSSGNLAERTAIASRVRDGSVVVDLFAGIGYFSLPIAVHARAKRIYACELNPVAFHYLLENLRLNRVGNVVPLPGDCRRTAPRGVADMVLLGHFDARDYLDVALDALRGAGLLVYHELCPKEQFPGAPVAHVTEAAKARWYDVESAESRIVKSYAPGIVHAVVHARVRRRPRAPMSG